jgi:uncharacterized protein (TIGR02145 family)
MRYSFLLLVIALVALIFNSCKDKLTNPTTTYEQVTIGTQVWMTKNLDVDHYRNGDPIPEVKDSVEWANLKTGAWCYYNNDPVLGKKYGKLYNWFAVNDPRGLAPHGWHVPSDSEWTILTIFLGGDSIASAKMRERDTTHWITTNIDVTNESGFTALPGGKRSSDGTFAGIRYNCTFYSTSKFTETGAWIRDLFPHLSRLYRGGGSSGTGYSIRCIKD